MQRVRNQLIYRYYRVSSLGGVKFTAGRITDNREPVKVDLEPVFNGFHCKKYGWQARNKAGNLCFFCS